MDTGSEPIPSNDAAPADSVPSPMETDEVQVAMSLDVEPTPSTSSTTDGVTQGDNAQSAVPEASEAQPVATSSTGLQNVGISVVQSQSSESQIPQVAMEEGDSDLEIVEELPATLPSRRAKSRKAKVVIDIASSDEESRPIECVAVKQEIKEEPGTPPEPSNSLSAPVPEFPPVDPDADVKPDIKPSTFIGRIRSGTEAAGASSDSIPEPQISQIEPEPPIASTFESDMGWSWGSRSPDVTYSSSHNPNLPSLSPDEDAPMPEVGVSLGETETEPAEIEPSMELPTSTEATSANLVNIPTESGHSSTDLGQGENTVAQQVNRDEGGAVERAE